MFINSKESHLLHEIWRLPRVLATLGKSRSSFYTDLSQGLWTRPVSLGPRARGWPAAEVIQLVKAIIAGLSNKEIRELVLELERSRRMDGE